MSSPASGDHARRAADDALAGRYQLQLHGWADLPRWQTPRTYRRRTSRRQPYTTTPADFSLASFADPENLIAAYRILRATGGHGAGDDGLSFADFSESESFGALRVASRAILQRTYVPYPTLPVPVPKGGGRFRELRLQRIVDRTIAKALLIALAGYWEGVLPNLRRDVWTLYAQLEWAIMERGWYFLATDDVRDFYPSLRLDDVMCCHRAHLVGGDAQSTDEPDLMWLVETVLRGHEGAERLRGLDQGSPCVPAAAELTLHSLLDQPLDAGAPGHPLLYRYVDNVSVLCSSAHVGHRTLEEISRLLTPHDLSLKREDGNPVDLRDEGHGRKVLGLIPVWRGDHLGFHVQESAYESLREGLESAWDHHTPVLAARRVLEGWLQALGPTHVDSDADDVINRAMDVAAEMGIRSLSPHHLVEVTHDARRQWLEVRQGVLAGCDSRHEDGGDEEHPECDVVLSASARTIPPDNRASRPIDAGGMDCSMPTVRPTEGASPRHDR